MATDSQGRRIDPMEDLVQLALGLTDVDPVEDEGSQVMSPEEARLISETARQALESNPRLTKPDQQAGEFSWLEDYLQLFRVGWPWRIASFIAWAASPKQNRWPKTQEELAHLIGLTTDRAIGNWRRKNPSIDQVVAIMQAAPLIAHRRDIYQALAISASDPNHRSNPDRKLALEVLGDYTPRMKVEDDRLRAMDGAQTMSRAQLEKLAGAEFVGDQDTPPLVPPSEKTQMEGDETPLTPPLPGGERSNEDEVTDEQE